MYKLINQQIPVLSVKNFHKLNFLSKRSLVYKISNNEKKYFTLEKGHNFPLYDDLDDFTQKIYKKFIKICKNIFGDISIIQRKQTCFSYHTNYEKNFPIWHNHLNTCTINGVYYINVNPKMGGEISFRDGDKKLIYEPSNYELLIFPNYLYHVVYPIRQNYDRYSLNLEINTSENSYDLFNNLKFMFN